MKQATHPNDKVAERNGPTECGYAAWKRAKVARVLEQAEERSAMIPVEQVLLR